MAKVSRSIFLGVGAVLTFAGAAAVKAVNTPPSAIQTIANLHNPYPTPVFNTEYDQLGKTEVKAVYLMTSAGIGYVAHSAYLMVTADDRVIAFRAGPEYEPKIDRHVVVGLPASLARLHLASPESTFDFGRLKATMLYLQEANNENRLKRTSAEDGKTTSFETVNFVSIEQGKGIGGLTPRPDVKITLFEENPSAAQKIFKHMLAVEELINKREFAYALLPYRNGITGANCHTVSSIVAERADRELMLQGKSARYERRYRKQGAIKPGASSSPLLRGPNLATIERLAAEGPDSLPVRNREIARHHRMQYSA